MSSDGRNPRSARPWTGKQAAARKDQAERLTRDVLEDADEIAVISVTDAESRHNEIVPNPWRKNVKRRSSSAASQDDDKAIQTNAEPALAKSKPADQQDRISKLEAKNADDDSTVSGLKQLGDSK